MADHRLFHLQGRVLGHRQSGRDQGRQAGATRLSQQQRGLWIDVDKDDLDRGHVRLVALGNFLNSVKQQFEASGKIAALQRAGLDGAAGNVGELSGVGLDHAKTSDPQSGIDAKNTHGGSGARAGAHWPCAPESSGPGLTGRLSSAASQNTWVAAA